MAAIPNNDPVSIGSGGYFIDSALFPEESYVVSGVTYGPNNVFTGTYTGTGGAADTATTWPDEILELMADQLFYNLDTEEITYIPDAGAERTILALVDRDLMSRDPNTPYGVGPRMEITVKNDSTEGISSDEINAGKDKISIPIRIGLDASDRMISQVLYQNDGIMILEVR